MSPPSSMSVGFARPRAGLFVFARVGRESPHIRGSRRRGVSLHLLPCNAGPKGDGRRHFSSGFFQVPAIGKKRITRKEKEVSLGAATERPIPPETLFGESRWFRPITPADGVAEWVQASFLAEDAPLHNPDHKHLFFADIAYLWAAVENSKHMRRVVGQCEEVMIRAGGWQKARAEQQFYEWFGRVPKFLITLDAHYARDCGDLEWCALIEHELYHVGHRPDEFGQPAFTKDGFPKLDIRGHDVEEFVGIVRRYGVGAAAGDTAKLIEAAKHPAEIGRLDIAHACGTCMLRAA